MLRQKIKKHVLILATWALAFSAMGQRVAVKTNALYWCGGVPNVGLDLRLNRHVTLGIDAAGTNYTISKISNRIVAVMPEFRYWFYGRPQAGHAVGGMLLAANYRTKWGETSHHGDAVGVGPTYSYSFEVGKHWSLEASVGAGFLYAREYKYTDGKTTETPQKHFLFAPLKLGLSFVYIFN